EQDVAAVDERVKDVLRTRHRFVPGEDDDFTVRSMQEMFETSLAASKVMSQLLAAIASISLLVGGIGIMNTLLVSVTERTREIGIRMAVGARSKNILRQFLVESVVLSCVGGAIGLGLGVAASAGITAIINSLSSGSDWPVVISIPAAFVAMA